MQTRPRVTCRAIALGTMAFAATVSFAGLANEGKTGLYAKSIPEVLALDDSQVDLATAALIVSEKWSTVVQGLRYRDKLDEMVLQIQERLRVQGLSTNHEAIPVINQYLFEELGFTAVSHADDPNDLFLHSVMDSRKGYCLSLSILYLSLGERLGLPLYGVVVPGHFFVRYDSGSVRFNIETTARGASASDDHYRLANRVPEEIGRAHV
jgi:regulator of sirC expression with transglutaminase-like and TPR domain